MIIQTIPLFYSGQILRKEMLVSLADYTYQYGALLSQDCTDGILSGCALTTTEDSIIVNPGVVRFEGALYLIKEPLFCQYSPTNTTRILQLVFHDPVRTEASITREIETCFTDERSNDKRMLELCRFKLQPGARLRYEYTSFADRETEFDTLNTIYSQFCGLGEPTLLPDITRHFANVALESGADGMDGAFCLQILAQREPVQREALKAYIRKKLGLDTPCNTNIQIYHGLVACLSHLERKDSTEKKARSQWRLMVD